MRLEFSSVDPVLGDVRLDEIPMKEKTHPQKRRL
jgi:hypothetical protein